MCLLSLSSPVWAVATAACSVDGGVYAARAAGGITLVAYSTGGERASRLWRRHRWETRSTQVTRAIRKSCRGTPAPGRTRFDVRLEITSEVAATNRRTEAVTRAPGRT